MNDTPATGAPLNNTLGDHDENDLVFRISSDGVNIRIDFGKPVAWLVTPPDSALQLAETIIYHVRNLQDRTHRAPAKKTAPKNAQ